MFACRVNDGLDDNVILWESAARATDETKPYGSVLARGEAVSQARRRHIVAGSWTDLWERSLWKRKKSTNANTALVIRFNGGIWTWTFRQSSMPICVPLWIIAKILTAWSSWFDMAWNTSWLSDALTIPSFSPCTRRIGSVLVCAQNSWRPVANASLVTIWLTRVFTDGCTAGASAMTEANADGAWAANASAAIPPREWPSICILDALASNASCVALAASTTTTDCNLEANDAHVSVVSTRCQGSNTSLIETTGAIITYRFSWSCTSECRSVR